MHTACSFPSKMTHTNLFSIATTSLDTKRGDAQGSKKDQTTITNRYKHYPTYLLGSDIEQKPTKQGCGVQYLRVWRLEKESHLCSQKCVLQPKTMCCAENQIPSVFSAKPSPPTSEKNSQLQQKKKQKQPHPKQGCGVQYLRVWRLEKESHLCSQKCVLQPKTMCCAENQIPSVFSAKPSPPTSEKNSQLQQKKKQKQPHPKQGCGVQYLRVWRLEKESHLCSQKCVLQPKTMCSAENQIPSVFSAKPSPPTSEKNSQLQQKKKQKQPHPTKPTCCPPPQQPHQIPPRHNQ